ncbi:MAG TPA: HutD family protein [Candidatus Nanopelagicales bacterium]|nr:HutD family protein [Candidatus Nanopelagicales bacterium]
MTLQILRADEHPVVAWANGRGVTEIVVSWPPGEDEFEWRVSIATVEDAGAFSSYAGIDRILVVASGGPLVLGVDGTLVAAERLDPVSFSGDAETVCLDVRSRARVINVMTRRDRATAAVSVLEASADGGTQPPARVRAPETGFAVALVVRGTATVGEHLLTAYDAALSLDDLEVHGPATLVVARIEPV